MTNSTIFTLKLEFPILCTSLKVVTHWRNKPKGINFLPGGRFNVNELTYIDFILGIVLYTFYVMNDNRNSLMKLIYDRRSGKDRRENKNKQSLPIKDSEGEEIREDRRVFGDRRRTEGLEISTADIAEEEFDEVFKQFQKVELEENLQDCVSSKCLDIITYQVLYREGVECAYITILHTNEGQEVEPLLYAFREEEINGDSSNESKPLYVQNIFGEDAYNCYLEQGWKDISMSENLFPWAIKAWLAQNMKQDTIKSR
jgi:hypothetical protein